MKLFPRAKVYQDWRVLLDKEGKNLDSANVSTPDHMHASIAVSAMQLGINIYGQKPLAHDIYEVRRMMKIAHKKKLVTQMGIHMHSSAPFRTAVRVVQDGVDRQGQGSPLVVPEIMGRCLRPGRTEAIRCPRISTGTSGSAFARIVRLSAANITIRPTGASGWISAPARSATWAATFSIRFSIPWVWPSRSRFVRKARRRMNGTGRSTARFFTSLPGRSRTASKILPITWYDGAAKPPAEVVALLEGDALPEAGSIFIGTEGVMLLPNYLRPTLYPRAKFKDYEYPEAGEVNHYAQFVNACRGEGKTTTGFAYSGPLTEAILLGGIASRFPQTTLKWNAKKMKFNLSEANQFLRRKYRKGWSVKGLS